MAVSFWEKIGGFFTGKSGREYSDWRNQRKRDKGKIQESLVGRGFGDIIDKYGNLGADENGNRTSEGNSRGDSFNNTQLAEMQYNHDEAQIDRQWQEDMYRKYQSPEAQMRQYDDAGLNRALAYNGGVDINGPSGGSAASADVAVNGESPVNGYQRAMGVMSTVMELLLGGSNLATSLKSISNQSKSVENDTSRTNAQNALTSEEQKKTAEETKGIKIDNDRKQLQYTIELATKMSVISQKQAEAAIAEWNADVLAGTPVEEATQNVLTKYKIDKETLANLQSDTDKNKAYAALVRGRNTREEAKNRADIQEIQARIAEINTEAEFNKVHTDVEKEIHKSAKAKAFYDKYAADNNLPLGDYTALALFRHYHLWYTKTQDSKYLTMMNEIRDMLYKNMGKDFKITWKDVGGYVSGAVNSGIKAAATIAK